MNYESCARFPPYLLDRLVVGRSCPRVTLRSLSSVHTNYLPKTMTQLSDNLKDFMTNHSEIYSLLGHPRIPAPKIVCLCGSTRFKNAFEEANRHFTMDGYIVLQPGSFPHADGIELTAEEKRKLDILHLRKIDLADIVYIVNVNGYIGNSTATEIFYAYINNKKIVWLEELRDIQNPSHPINFLPICNSGPCLDVSSKE